MKNAFSVVIVCKNEAAAIGPVLQSVQHLTDEQVRDWSREQKDRWWLENVWRGDMPQLTLRSAATASRTIAGSSGSRSISATRPDARTPRAGYTPAQLVGRNVFDLMHPDDVEHARAALERLMLSPGAALNSETRRVWFQLGGAPARSGAE